MATEIDQVDRILADIRLKILELEPAVQEYRELEAALHAVSNALSAKGRLGLAGSTRP